MVKVAFLAAMFLAFARGASALPLIDNFDRSQTVAQDNSNGIASSSATRSPLDPSTIIGGEREVYVNAFSGADEFNGTRAGVSGSRFSFANDAGVVGFGALRWDGSSVTGFDLTNADLGINRAGFAPVNFSAVADSLKLTMLRSDASFPFTLQFFSGATDWTSFTFSAIPVCSAADSSCMSQAGAVAGPTDFYFNFALINLLGTKSGTGADFSSITAMQAIFNFNPMSGSPGQAESIDFSMDFATVSPPPVPEPGTLTLSILGLFSLMCMVARRRHSN